MKPSRHTKILELVANNNIETQEELADMLIKSGYPVTQATVSRDIRELKLTKITEDNGGQKYAASQTEEIKISEKYLRVLSDGLMSMDHAQNILVVKTVSGMAMAVAAAIDSLKLDGVVGCIAGDDTIMCAIRTVDETKAIMTKIKNIVGRN